jgi:hypothetical protein
MPFKAQIQELEAKIDAMCTKLNAMGKSKRNEKSRASLLEELERLGAERSQLIARQAQQDQTES